MEVNFFGSLLMLQAAARAMRASPPARGESPSGAVVNLASRAGVVGVPSMAVYGATKAALISLTRSAALELAPAIRVNAVAPGATETPMMRTWIEEQDDPGAFEAALAATVPLGRLARPEEVAERGPLPGLSRGFSRDRRRPLRRRRLHHRLTDAREAARRRRAASRTASVFSPYSRFMQSLLDACWCGRYDDRGRPW